MWQDRSKISAALIIALALAHQVIALAPRAPFNDFLIRRQVDSTACTSACSVFTNAVNSCTTTSCFCDTDIANGLQSCVNCAVSISSTPGDVIASAQDLISTYENTCQGFSLPTLTVPSGSSTGGSTSVSISVSVPITSQTAASSVTNVVVTSSAVVVTSPTIISTTTNPIVQMTVHSSTATVPATTSSAVTSGAIGNSPRGIMVVGLHVGVGCLLGSGHIFGRLMFYGLG